MYGRSPLSVVVVSITVQLNTCPPLEHWTWYSVITPFGVAGALQLTIIDFELLAKAETWRGGPAGTVQPHHE